MLKNKNNKGRIAIFQILVLVVAIIAFSFIAGNNLGLVSADEGETPTGLKDSDGDGIWDRFDKCPNEPGTLDGCPTETDPAKIYENQQEENNAFSFNNVLGTIGSGVAGQVTNKGVNAVLQTTKETAKNTGGGGGGGVGILEFFFSGPGKESSYGGAIFGYVVVAAAGALLARQAFQWFGAGARNMEQATTGAIVGGSTAVATAGIWLIIAESAATGPPGWAIGLIAAVVTAAYTMFNYQDFAKEEIMFLPQPWAPQDGGEHCEECNELRYGCSEYQCNTYGKNCGLVNKGTDKEKCVHLNPDDTTPPKISALNGSLPAGFKYIPKTIHSTSPPTRGVQVVPKEPKEEGEECIPPYTALTLGINTSEPAECKIDTERKNKYENMVTPLGSYKLYEHYFKIPSSATPSGWEVKKSFRGANDTTQETQNLLEDFNLNEANDYEFYIRCKDPNGNVAPQNFVMDICVQDGPDTEAPEIIQTNYPEGESYIEFNKSSVPLTVETNEPATCRWDRKNLDYKNMQNDLQRSGGNDLGHYIHEGTITDVRDRETNTFYIKCQDKPGWNEGDSGKQWANKNPYTLILHGTRPLLIDEATVNGKTNGTTIKNSTDNVGVNFRIKTSSGANNGEARCYYGPSEGSENIMFYNDGRQGFNHINEQKGIYLNEGNYTYYFECEDQGGNIARTSLSFTIDVDTEAPEIIRAYKGDGSLRLTTSEEGECVYSSSEDRGCTYSYEEGIKMDKSLDSNVHMTDWNPEETFYVKCQDKYGNRALPGECSIIVRPFEI